ncbi:hypothetical protein HYZ99_00530 [Candidatus Peregrinibacteria bacterium]|nr:hypothetical protein [Candidatus Peregrinibacteria bacterium]
MSNRIIINGQEINLISMEGTTVLRASSPIRCPKCEQYRQFFYHVQMEIGEPSLLVCSETCHLYLKKQLASHSGDHFLIRGIEAPLPTAEPRFDLPTKEVDANVTGVISMEPSYFGKPTPEVLRCFQIRVLKNAKYGTFNLSLDFCTQSMLQCKGVAPNEVKCRIRSLQWGLALGHAAAGYKQVGDMWVPSKERKKF